MQTSISLLHSEKEIGRLLKTTVTFAMEKANEKKNRNLVNDGLLKVFLQYIYTDIRSASWNITIGSSRKLLQK